jgi:hypothetical protein
MKHTSLAFAAALLGATALAPAAWSQTPAPAETPTPQTTSPATSGSSASSPSASPGDKGQSNMAQAERDGREGWSGQSNWRSSWRDDDDDDDRGRWTSGRSGRDEDDEHDDDRGSRYDRDREGAPWMRGRGRETGGRQDRGMGDMGGMGMSGAKMRGMSPEMARMHSRMMRAHHAMGPRGMMGPRPQGARLNLKRGDATINIRCPADEPIAACVDAVTKLMDKLHSVPQTP